MADYALKTKFEKDNKHLGSISNESKITFQKTTPTLNISIPAGTYNAESNFNIQVTPKILMELQLLFHGFQSNFILMMFW